MNAFSGTYADFKLVKTRGVVQIIFEVPVEQSTAVLKILGGMPTPAEEKWFGIAPLDPKLMQERAVPSGTFAGGDIASDCAEIPLSGGKCSAGTPSGGADSSNLSRSTKPKQAWNDMAPSQQAGLLCSDPDFWKFLQSQGMDIHNVESAAGFVRNHCRVTSRSEIVEGDKSNDYWQHLVWEFRHWQRLPEYIEYVA